MALSKGFARNNAKTPLDQREADMATIVCNADGSPRVGVLGGANASIVTHGGGMNLAVAAAEFVTSKGKADGVMIFTNDGSMNVLIGAAPASNSRIDVLWVKHFDDTTGDTAGQFNPAFGVTAGVAAASPVKPAIPTGALELATLRIYSGTVATNGGANVLTNTYQMTAARGGLVPFRTKTELDAWTNPTPWQRAYVLDTGDEYGRAAGAWGVRLDAFHQANPGTTIAGIDPSTTGATDLPNGFIMKTGSVTSSTSVAFGNEYFANVNFVTPFPNKCLHVSITMLSSGNTYATDGQAISTDDVTPSGFRPLVRGSGVAKTRAFMWAAFGY